MKNITCTWWALPEWVKSIIKPKHKKTWTFPVYKSEGKDWYMDIPSLLTFKELLTGGTEECLDWWYKEQSGKDPVPGSKFKMTLSDKPTPSYTTKIIHEPTEMYSAWVDGDDSYWWDPVSKKTIWLCPYLPWLMGGIPDKMYVSLEVVK